MVAMVPTSTTQSRAVTRPTGLWRRRPPRSRRVGRSGARTRCATSPESGAAPPAQRASVRSSPATPVHRRRVLAGGAAVAQQVSEKPIRARNAGRQLTEERQAGVDEAPFAMLGDQQATFQRGLAVVVGGQQRRVLVVPALGEVQPAFLHPTVEVARADAVRTRKDRVVGNQDGHLGPLVGDPAPVDLEGVGPDGRGQLSPSIAGVVLDHEASAGLDPAHERRMGGGQVFLPGIIGPHAEDDGVVVVELSSLQRRDIDGLDVHARGAKVFGDGVSRTRDVADAAVNEVSQCPASRFEIQFGIWLKLKLLPELLL